MSPGIRLMLRFLVFSLLTVAICYANSVSNPFLQDDLLIVSGNKEIRQITPLHFLRSPYSQDERFAGTYRPLTILSVSVDYALWGDKAAGFRIINLLLHALNGCLVFALANGFLGSIPAAWAAATVYLVHPVHTEVVVGIVGRSELLAATFIFSAWLFFRHGHTAWSALAFFLALLSKEHAITFPAVVALDVVLLGDGFRELLRKWARLFVLALAAVAYLALRLWVLGGFLVPRTHQYLQGSLTPLERIMTTGRVFLQYFKLIFMPIDVIGVYEFYSIPTASSSDGVAWAGLVLVAGTLLFAVIMARTSRIVSFAILFFFLTLLPVANWFVPIGAIMAERFLYTPLFGAALLAGLLWTALPSGRVRQLTAAGILTVAVLLCISHNYVWHDDLTFYGNMVRIFPNNMSGRLGYGYAMLNRGRPEEAVQQFESAHRIAPMRPAQLAEIAGDIAKKDPEHCDHAQPLLDAAFKEEPNHGQSYWVMANCAAVKHRWENADELYRLANEHVPAPSADLLFSWGLTLEALGRKVQAVQAYESARLISPNDPDIERRLELLK